MITDADKKALEQLVVDELEIAKTLTTDRIVFRAVVGRILLRWRAKCECSCSSSEDLRQLVDRMLDETLERKATTGLGAIVGDLAGAVHGYYDPDIDDDLVAKIQRKRRGDTP